MSIVKMLLKDWEALTPSAKQTYLFENRLFLNRYIDQVGKSVNDKAVFVEFKKYADGLMLNKEAYKNQRKSDLLFTTPLNAHSSTHLTNRF